MWASPLRCTLTLISRKMGAPIPRSLEGLNFISCCWRCLHDIISAYDEKAASMNQLESLEIYLGASREKSLVFFKMRSSYCDKTGLKRGAWTPDEDRKLSDYIKRYGNWNWRELPKFAGLTRCGKSCRLRWMNYLRPNIKRGNYTREEEEIIINLRETLGNRWSAIAAKLPGRTDNEIKNHWHTHLKKRLQKTLTPRKEAIRQSIELPRKCESESEPNTSLDNSSGPSILESSSVVSMSHEKTTCDDTSTLTTYDVTSFPADMKSVITKTPMSDENITIDDVFSGDFWTEPFQMVGYNSANNFTSSQVDPELVFPPSPAYSFYSDYDMDFYFNHLPVLEEELPILF